MLNIKPFMQKSGYCGPASLKMILNFYGLNKTEKELAKLTGASKSKGVGAEGILKAARKLGFKGFYKDFSSFDDIKKRIPSLPDPRKAIEKRIMIELTEIQRNRLFVK